MFEPRRELPIAFLRVEVMANIGPLAQGGIDGFEARGSACGPWVSLNGAVPQRLKPSKLSA